MSGTPQPALTLGTAGHIDHGKTALVGALTGRDTDRLPEERRRGISIELGFAELDLGTERMSVVDVPGHERFVRTMVAGASGIDCFLMTVAADDGVMPQTREHATVLGALGVEHGVVALTKRDLVDGELAAVAAREARELLPGIRVVETSVRDGSGLRELRDALAALAGRLPPRDVEDGALPILHVDRTFTLHGIGTVVTGTLVGGALEVGERTELLPSGLEARIRSLQVHDRAVERAEPGSRVAINLAGVARDEVRRGELLTAPGSGLAPTWRLDTELELSRPPRPGERVQLHHGTSDVPARLVDLGTRSPGRPLVQTRLEEQLVARAGDRIVIRRIAPPDTLGGGVVVDPHPRRRGTNAAPQQATAAPGRRGDEPAEPAAAAERDPLELAGAAEAIDALRADGASPRAPGDLAPVLGLDREELQRLLDALSRAGHLVRVAPGVYYPAEVFDELRERTLELARRPGGVALAELRDRLGASRKYAQALLERLDAERLTLRREDVHVARRRSPG